MCTKKDEIVKLVVPEIVRMLVFIFCLLTIGAVGRKSAWDLAADAYAQQQAEAVQKELSKKGGVIDQLKSLTTAVQSLVDQQKAANMTTWAVYKRDIEKYVHRAQDDNPYNDPTADNIDKVALYLKAIPESEMSEVDKRNADWLINVYKPPKE
jgi:hypothetical protein